jgi:membrane protein DedA with SNARE-associated domain
MITYFLEIISSFIVETMKHTGYLGLFILMTLESALMPIPSEIVMPFAGYLVYLGHFDLALVVIISSIANLVGSWIGYYLGIKVGRKFVLKYGKYLLIKEEHVEKAEKWMNKHGTKVILASRNMPAIRTIIPLPAGILRVNFVKFSIFTFIGSIPWNFLLTYIGYILGEKWYEIKNYTQIIDLILIFAIIFIIIFLIIKYKRKLTFKRNS